MARFILYDLDPTFWARVQAKARAEGVSVKARILQLLTAWLGVIVLAVLSTACAYHSPTAPTPAVVVPSTAAASIRLVSGSRLDYTTQVIATVLTADGHGVADLPIEVTTAAGTIATDAVVTNAVGSVTAIVSTPTATTVTARSGTLSTSIQITGASAPVPPAPSPVPVPPSTTSTPIVSLAPTVTTVGVSTGFSVSFVMPDGTRIVSTAWTFGDGTSGQVASWGIAHTYTTVGSFTVSVTAIDALGRAASTSAPVTVNAVPLPPAPPPAAPPAVPALLLSLSCTVAPHGASTSCNIAARDETGANVTAALTHAIWDFGDGSVDETYLQLAHRVYAQAGTYVISVTATGPGGRIGHASTTVIIP